MRIFDPKLVVQYVLLLFVSFPPSVFRLINYFQFNSSLQWMTCCPNLYLTCKICIREKLWFKYTSLLSEAFFLVEQKSQYKGDVTRDDSQRRFLEQHILATLLRHCFEWLQHCSNFATPCCSKNRRCESSRVLNITLKDDCKVGITISGWDITRPCWFINGKG